MHRPRRRGAHSQAQLFHRKGGMGSGPRALLRVLGGLVLAHVREVRPSVQQ